MQNKISNYIFIQILKSCTLIFFIFISISWLLQVTRLFTLTNLLQIDILNVILLSFYLIPNLFSVILPFIVIFGVLLCFIKLNKDREIIAIYSLGLETKPIKIPIIIFTIILIIFYIFVNFYFSPKIYSQYKLKEFELRNTINFDKMIISNFVKLNQDTTIDFKKDKNLYKDIFINFKDEKENIIFAENGKLQNNGKEFIFQLNEGFKLSINNNNEIEKLEFKNYLLKLENTSHVEFNNFDRNTLTVFDDIKLKNYKNIAYRSFDVLIIIFIIYFFYVNNIIKNDFKIKNNLLFIILSIFVLILNQFLKNTEISINYYLIFLTLNIIIILLIQKFNNYYKIR